MNLLLKLLLKLLLMEKLDLLNLVLCDARDLFTSCQCKLSSK